MSDNLRKIQGRSLPFRDFLFCTVVGRPTASLRVVKHADFSGSVLGQYLRFRKIPGRFKRTLKFQKGWCSNRYKAQTSVLFGLWLNSSTPSTNRIPVFKNLAPTQFLCFQRVPLIQSIPYRSYLNCGLALGAQEMILSWYVNECGSILSHLFILHIMGKQCW